MKYLYLYEDFGSGEYASYDNSNDDIFWGNIAGGALPFCVKTKRFMLNYRSKYVNEPNTYGLWGGKLDSGENIEDAVKREFYEESGYSNKLKLVPVFVFKNNTGTFEYHNFIAILDQEFTPKLDWESDGFEWVTFDELLEIESKHPGLKLLLKDKNTIEIINKL